MHDPSIVYSTYLGGSRNTLLRRMTVKTTLVILLLWVLYAGSGTVAQAVCTGTSVHAFGAKGADCGALAEAAAAVASGM